jgi:16S rRNA (cytidine1402-2'-O)-methyltransferase
VGRDTLPVLAAHFAAQAARGEITVVVGPAPEEAPADFGVLLEQAMRTHSLREAVALVAEATQTPRRAVYKRALEMRGKDVLF